MDSCYGHRAQALVSNNPGFKFQLCHLLAVGFGVSYSLDLIFLNHKTGIIRRLNEVIAIKPLTHFLGHTVNTT